VDDASSLYLGLISGTSADGIDAALVRFENDRPRLVAALTHPWPDDLRERILRVAQDEERLCHRRRCTLWPKGGGGRRGRSRRLDHR